MIYEYRNKMMMMMLVLYCIHFPWLGEMGSSIGVISTESESESESESTHIY